MRVRRVACLEMRFWRLLGGLWERVVEDWVGGRGAWVLLAGGGVGEEVGGSGKDHGGGCVVVLLCRMLEMSGRLKEVLQVWPL